MTKIKTLIAHNNDKITKSLVNEIEGLEYVEVVGSAKTGEETYNKIVELRPEIVFVEFNMGDMNALEMMQRTANILGKEETPLFKFIAKDISVDKTNDKYELNKKENENKNKEESVAVKGIGIKGIVEEIEKYVKEIEK